MVENAVGSGQTGTSSDGNANTALLVGDGVRSSNESKSQRQQSGLAEHIVRLQTKELGRRKEQDKPVGEYWWLVNPFIQLLKMCPACCLEVSICTSAARCSVRLLLAD